MWLKLSPDSGGIFGGKMEGHLVSKQSSSHACAVVAFVAAKCKDQILEQILVACLAACGWRDKAKYTAIDFDTGSIPIKHVQVMNLFLLSPTNANHPLKWKVTITTLVTPSICYFT